MRKYILSLLALMAVSFAMATRSRAADVFVMSSHVESSEWAHNMMRPILQLEQERPEFSFTIAYLRLLAHLDVQSLQHHVDSLLDAQGTRPKLVVLVGGSCFNFASDIDKRWHGVPMLLLGEQDYYSDIDYTLLGPGDPLAARYPVSQLRDLGCNLTLISSRCMVRRTLNMILTVQPDLDNLIIVSGENYMSKENLLRLVKYIDDTYPELPYKVYSSSEHTTDQLISMLEKESGPRSAVLYMSWLVRDGYSENVATRHSTVSLLDHLIPVYTMYASDIDLHPYLVGYFSSPAVEYERNVRLRMLDVLDGGYAPAAMPFVYLDAGVPTLNYRAMEHYGLDTSLIPDNAVVINGPLSLWLTYKKQIMWMAFFVLMGLFFFVFFIMSRSMNSLRKARNIAEEANKIKTAFIQNMSHEVRTPLNSIIGFSQLLCLPDGLVTEDEKSQYLDYIMNDARLLTMMVNDMLSISDMENGVYSVHLEPTNLNEMARQAIKSVENRLPSGVRLIVQPGIEEDALYMADGMRVQQIMLNLLTNACKHTSRGHILFGSSLVENHGYITFYVEDTGPGVPLDKANEIFERFVKLNKHKQGLGLGLSICRQLALSMGGNIWLDTSYTDGARFVFTIPWKPARPDSQD